MAPGGAATREGADRASVKARRWADGEQNMNRTGTRIVVALVQNEAGTLNRLVSQFRRCGFNLSSLNVGECEQEGYSRLTLVVNAGDPELNQCVAQLSKLVEVVEVSDLPREGSVGRELALIQVSASGDGRREVVEVVQLMGGKVVWLTHDRLAVELSDEPAKIDRLIDLLRPHGLHEVVRTGLVAMNMA
jgi:acetolactate synthase I/III small subunit